MDAYITIAEQVLRVSRRPMSAREILKAAYLHGFVPYHLHGLTQHKTLGARLSEDILDRQDRSAFFRSSPGRFFLAEFLDDPAIPLEHRTRFIARRRLRQLAQLRPLALRREDLPATRHSASVIPTEVALRLIKDGRFHYARSTKDKEPGDILVWTFVLVERDGLTLSYRHGHYREHRDTFTNKRALGFYSPVTEQDRTLFDLEDHGVVTNGLRTVSMDLGLSSLKLRSSLEDVAILDRFVLFRNGESSALLGVVRFSAPDWFEPYARRLAINDLQWLDTSRPVNHLEDFDPWSRAVLSTGVTKAVKVSRDGR